MHDHPNTACQNRKKAPGYVVATHVWIRQSSTNMSSPFVRPWVSPPPESPVLSRPSMPCVPRWLCLLQWKKTSTLSPHVFARLKRIQRPLLATPAPQALGTYSDSHWLPRVPWPGASDDNKNTRRGLDTFSSPDDEHARSAVLLHLLSVSGQRPTYLPTTNPSGYIANRWLILQTCAREES